MFHTSWMITLYLTSISNLDAAPVRTILMAAPQQHKI